MSTFYDIYAYTNDDTPLQIPYEGYPSSVLLSLFSLSHYERGSGPTLAVHVRQYNALMLVRSLKELNSQRTHHTAQTRESKKYYIKKQVVTIRKVLQQLQKWTDGKNPDLLVPGGGRIRMIDTSPGGVHGCARWCRIDYRTIALCSWVGEARWDCLQGLQ